MGVFPGTGLGRAMAERFSVWEAPVSHPRPKAQGQDRESPRREASVDQKQPPGDSGRDLGKVSFFVSFAD